MSTGPECGGESRADEGIERVESVPPMESAEAPSAAPGSDPVASGEPVGSPAALSESLLYGLSFPERLVRGVIGLSAGAARELAEVLVPQAFKDSASYKLAIENSLGFLTETVGGVPGRGDPAGAIPGQCEADGANDAEAGEQIARKAVGNFIDLAGLATLHVSPMWMLAVVNDVAYGTGTFTRELALELQAQGVIDDAATIHHVDDILAAVQRTCGTAAGTFDSPPLSVEELKRTIDEARRDLSEADVRRLIPEAELRRYWADMRAVASAEQVTLLGVSAAITMQAFGKAKAAGQSTLIGARVAGGILNRNVVAHYREALTRIVQQGLFATVRESYGPYVTAVWGNFSREKTSWTERVLDPGNASRVVSGVWKRIWRREVAR
jgi:hypothetical protein